MDIINEQELIERCKIYLNWLDLYMTTDQGKVLWNAAAPYIYQPNGLSISATERTFEMIIDYYFKKSEDKFDNCIDNIMLNYFMLNYCIINEPTLCERYGKALLDNAEYFKQSPAFQEYLKNQESKEVCIDLKKENESLKIKNKVIRKAFELVCKENYLNAECPYFYNHLPEFKVWENPCKQVCTVKEGHHYLCWGQHFLNIAIKELDKQD